jgi:hypothetical protein
MWLLKEKYSLVLVVFTEKRTADFRKKKLRYKSKATSGLSPRGQKFVL